MVTCIHLVIGLEEQEFAENILHQGHFQGLAPICISASLCGHHSNMCVAQPMKKRLDFASGVWLMVS